MTPRQTSSEKSVTSRHMPKAESASSSAGAPLRLSDNNDATYKRHAVHVKIAVVGLKCDLGFKNFYRKNVASLTDKVHCLARRD